MARSAWHRGRRTTRRRGGSPSSSSSTTSSSSSRSPSSRTCSCTTTRCSARWRPGSCCSRSGGSGSTPPGRSTGSIPQRGPVRVMIYASMLLGLFMSMSLPEAFGDARARLRPRPSWRCSSGRSLFTAWCFADQPSQRRNFLRIVDLARGLRASSGSPAGSRTGEARLALWIVALGIEYLGPWARYWTPGLGASRDGGLGRARRAYRRALRSLRDHLPRRDAADQRRDLRRDGMDADGHRRLPGQFPRLGGDVVALLPHRPRSAART